MTVQAEPDEGGWKVDCPTHGRVMTGPDKDIAEAVASVHGGVACEPRTSEPLTEDDERLLAAEHDEPREQARAAAGKHERLERLREMSRAASPGPWEPYVNMHAETAATQRGRGPFGVTLLPATGQPDYGRANIEFAIEAVNYVRRLLGEPDAIWEHNHVTRDVKPPGQCPGCDYRRSPT